MRSNPDKNPSRSVIRFATVRWPIAALLVAVWVPLASASDPTTVETVRLSNGIDVLLMPIEQSPGASMVLISPLGLCSDSPGRSQWSHLTERMLAAAIGKAPFDEINLETSPTAMLLKFSRDGDSWREGVDALATWLSPPPFPQDALDREKESILDAVDVVVEQRGTFRYALSVWGQSVADPVRRVSIKGDVRDAQPDALLAYHRSRFTAGARLVIAVVGRFPKNELIEALNAKIGSVEIHVASADRSGPTPGPASASPGQRANVTWDLRTNHVVFSWPLPPLDDVGKAMRTTIESGVVHLMQQHGQDYRVKRTRVTVPAGVRVDGRGYLVVEMTLRDVKEATLAWARADVQKVVDGFLAEDAHSRAAGRLRAIGIYDQYISFDAMLAEANRRSFPRRMLEANVAVFHGLGLFVNGPGIAKQIKILHGPDSRVHAEPWKKILTAENRRELVIMPEPTKPRPIAKPRDIKDGTPPSIEPADPSPEESPRGG